MNSSEKSEYQIQYISGEVPPLPVNAREVQLFNMRGMKALKFNFRGAYVEKTFYISETMKYLKFRSGWRRLWTMTKSKYMDILLVYCWFIVGFHYLLL
jgi:hypothetical protein